jgi:glycosyltransferase involved in cell wall biosynthesis
MPGQFSVRGARFKIQGGGKLAIGDQYQTLNRDTQRPSLRPDVTATAPSLVLLIPAYNEERRIGPVLDRYAEHFYHHYAGRFRIVVVLNGCRDNTLGIVRAAEQKYLSISHLEFAAPIGKGGALIEGLKLAPLADLIGYVDADGATSPAAFLDLVNRAVAGEADCIVASRWLPGAKINHAQPDKRRFASRLFHLFVEGFFWMGIRDTQCGAKVMRRRVIETIHGKLRLADLAFDVNLLFAAKRAGFTLKEVPTEWTDQSGSHVVFNFRTSLNMLLSLVRLRLLYSPFYAWLKPLRPLETWLYIKLNAPRPLSAEEADAALRRKPDENIR